MLNHLERFKNAIILCLLVIVAAVVALSIIIVIWEMISTFLTSQVELSGGDIVLDFFGLVLLVLIGVELLEAIQAYLKSHVVHVEIVLLLGLIAVVRKVIILDYERTSVEMLLGIGGVVVAVSIAYYLIKKALPEGVP